ncbi:hypothetical protein D3C85_1676330 [compost metagenome]
MLAVNDKVGHRFVEKFRQLADHKLGGFAFVLLEGVFNGRVVVFEFRDDIPR